MRGYEGVPATTVVAAADTVAGQRAKFHKQFPAVTMYADYGQMLEKEELDLVSVCTWPPLHEEMVVAAAEAGARGILCEKPMAVNLAQADRMLEACQKNDVKLIVGHQRRYNLRYVQAKEALKRGEIGDLLDVQGLYTGSDLLTAGTHVIDLMRYFVDDEPIDWLIGQIHRQVWGQLGHQGTRYGHSVEQASCARFQFQNGVKGLMEGGEIVDEQYYCHIILQGTDGRIESYGDKGPPGWRIYRCGQEGWVEHLIDQKVNAFAREIEELVRWIETGRDHLLKGESGRADLEVLIAIFESSRRRSKMDLPLDIMDHPLEEMVKAGEI
jgi:predicted dehydrogenase